MNQHLIVDFDRTLFNNHEFFQDFSTILANYYDIDGQELHNIAHRHDVVRSKATGIFSAFDEIREHHPKVDIAHLKQTTRSELGGRKYLFADVRRFLERLRGADIEPIIMTVGTDEYQAFKAEFAPEINVYEFIITQHTKSQKIAQLAVDRGFRLSDITLIDDRGDTFDRALQEMGIRGVRLDRVDSQYQHIESPSWVEEITSLGGFQLTD